MVKQGKCMKSEELQKKLAQGKCRLALKAPGSRAMTPEEVYQQALASVFVLGSVEQLPDHPGQWQEGRLATAWALSEDGVMATNFHVFDKMTVEGFAVANSRGEVFPVIDALGSDQTADIAVIRVAGKGLVPLPVAADERVGAWVAALSHPGGQFYTFTQGHVSRYIEEPGGGETQQWMSITTDFAYGSSGAGDEPFRGGGGHGRLHDESGFSRRGPPPRAADQEAAGEEAREARRDDAGKACRKAGGEGRPEDAGQAKSKGPRSRSRRKAR